ncbi:MAG: HPF/RaiA family ribosome-associated protein [Gemmatimonadota bacterium]
MHTIVTARHCEIDERLRERAQSVAERLAAVCDRAMDGAVVFDVDGGKPSAEIRLNLAGSESMVARAIGTDHRTALDLAEAKLRRQLERLPRAPRARGRSGPIVA